MSPQRPLPWAWLLRCCNRSPGVRAEGAWLRQYVWAQQDLWQAEHTTHSSAHIVHCPCAGQCGDLSSKLAESHIQSTSVPLAPAPPQQMQVDLPGPICSGHMVRGTPLRTSRAAIGLGTSKGPLPAPRPCSSHSKCEQGSAPHHWGHTAVSCRGGGQGRGVVGGLGWPFAFPGDLNPLELDVERGSGMAAWEQTCAALMSHVRW